MDEREYIKQRVDDQIQWHDATSGWNQRWYKRVQIATILLAALVPFVAVFEAVPSAPSWLYKCVVGLLGVAAAVAAGIAGVYRFQERWIDYRMTAETLRSEKFRFETRVAPYDGGDSFSKFVENVEAILAGQNERWHASCATQVQSPLPDQKP
jgi:hypothetical protein